MRLLDHLKATAAISGKPLGETLGEFAAGIGEAKTTIQKIAYGQRQPSLPLAIKISEATGGQVEPAAMVIEAGAAA